MKDKLQSTDLEKRRVEQHLEQALLAGEQLREDRDSVKLAALLKGQEVESLSREVARLIRQSFAKGNEIADLKEQSDERQAEIERLNEVTTLFWYFSPSYKDSKLLDASKRTANGKVRVRMSLRMLSRPTNFLQRRLDEVDDDETSASLPARGRSPSLLRPTKRTLVPRTQDHVTRIEEPIPWKVSPTVIHQPGQSSSSLKHNPFHNKSKEIRPTVVNGSSTLPRRKLFDSDWNLNRLKEKKRSESSLPFKVDSKGKPLVPVALGSRKRMSSRS